MTFYSSIDEKPDIDVEVYIVVVLQNKQVIYTSKDFLCNLELSTVLLDPKFDVGFHFINNHDGKTDTRNQTKHQSTEEAFASTIAKVEEVPIRYTLYDFMDIFMAPIINDKNAIYPALY